MLLDALRRVYSIYGKIPDALSMTFTAAVSAVCLYIFVVTLIVANISGIAVLALTVFQYLLQNVCFGLIFYQITSELTQTNENADKMAASTRFYLSGDLHSSLNQEDFTRLQSQAEDQATEETVVAIEGFESVVLDTLLSSGHQSLRSIK